MSHHQKKIQALVFRQNDLSSKRKALLDQLWVLEHEGEELRQEITHLIDECLRKKMTSSRDGRDGADLGDFNNQSETAEFNLIKSVTAVPSKRKGQ